ncbi:MAG: Ltp family lipoprotein [Eubacterium sp.]|nr:Ltp family lipoprotein [Eubacterium sp.]
MKKLIKKIITVLISIMLLSSCAEENPEVSIDTEQTQSDVSISETENVISNVYVRNLNWGMSLDEVKSYETEKLTKEELVDEGLNSEKTELEYGNIEFPIFLGDLSCKSDMILGVYTKKGLNEVTYKVTGESSLQAYNTFYEFLSENGFEDLDKDVIDTDNVKLRSGYSSKDKIYATISHSKDDNGNLLGRITFVPETFSLKESEQPTTAVSERVYEELADADIRNLKWGMSLEDVKLYELEKISKEKFFQAGYDKYGYYGNHTVLTYDNVVIPDMLELENQNFEMTICVYEDEGLTNVSYYTEGEKCSYIMGVLFNESQKKYGGFDADSGFMYFNSEDAISDCWLVWKDTDDSEIILSYTEESEYTSLPAYLYYYHFAPSNENDEDTKQTTQSSAPSSSSTMGEKNALTQAKNYLNIMPFSYSGLVEQLEYERYSHSEAVYGADNCGADWNEQAEKSAAKYLELMPFSRQELIEQLEYEGYTHSQAVHGAETNGY